MRGLDSRRRCVLAAFKHFHDKSHSSVHSVNRLHKIFRSFVIIHFFVYFIYSWERMKNFHRFFCGFQFFLIQNKNTVLLLIFFFACKAFTLYSCHVQHIQQRHCFRQTADLFIAAFRSIDYILDILRYGQLRRGDQNESVAFESRHCFDQRVNGTAVFQVTTQANAKVVKPTGFIVQSYNICQCLGGMEMSSVTCVDNRCRGIHSSGCGCSFERMTNCDDIRISAYDCDGVFEAFALCYRGILRIVKADNASAKAEHSCLEGHLRSCGRFIKQGCKYFALAYFGII